MMIDWCQVRYSSRFGQRNTVTRIVISDVRSERNKADVSRNAAVDGLEQRRKLGSRRCPLGLDSVDGTDHVRGHIDVKNRWFACSSLLPVLEGMAALGRFGRRLEKSRKAGKE